MRFDTVVVGGGPAGISCAVYCARAGLSVCLIHNDSGSLKKAEKIENYYALPPVSGKQMYADGLTQADSFGVKVIKDEVLDAAYGDCYELRGKENSVEALSLVLATGTGRTVPSTKGIAEFEGKGVSYCAVCDGFFFRGKTVAVLGRGSYAASEAGHLAPLASRVVILTDGNPPEAGFAGYEVITQKVVALEGNERLGGARLENGDFIPLDGLFVALGVAGAGALARKLGARLNGNSIAVEDDMTTNLPGLFAAGDCTGGLLQVSKAIGDGAKAAMSAIKYVKTQKK